MFSPLHRELGREPSGLTFDLITDAIGSAIQESEDIDWKSKLPDPDQHIEFAKDVAAMANSGGGLLVYGVAENRATSAATSVVSVEGWGDGEARRLRQVAYSRIQPPIHPLDFTEISGDQGRVVVLEVPASQETPHLVWLPDKSSFAAPIRYGTHTEYMSERQLDAAYAKRHLRTDDTSRRLTRMIDEVSRHVRWSPVLGVAAIPRFPRESDGSRRRTSGEFLQIVRNGTKDNPLSYVQSLVEARRPRPGYRRWMVSTHRPDVPHRDVQIHDDGAVSFGAGLSAQDEAAREIDDFRLQQAVAEAVFMVRCAAMGLGVQSGYTFRLDLRLPQRPVFILDTEHSSSERVPVHSFFPIDVQIDVTSSIGLLRSAVWETARDVLNEVGIREPSSSAISPPPYGD